MKDRDRELLEMAAKAAGIEIEPCTCSNPKWPYRFKTGSGNGHWNPLNHDGDALRLAIKLGVDLRIPCSPNQVFVQVGERGSVPFVLERIDGNPISATRRAIVRAAAEIGKEME